MASWKTVAMIFVRRLTIVQVLSLIMVARESVASNVSVCEETCGPLAIRYPFHLQASCSQPAYPEFRLSCLNSSASPIPVLQLSSHEYRVLSLRSGELTIDPILFNNCSFPNLQSFDLSGSPFSISSRNVLQLHNCSIAWPYNCNVAYLNLDGICQYFGPIGCQPLDPKFSQVESYGPVGQISSLDSFTGCYSNLLNFSNRFHCSTFTSWAYSSTNLSINAEYGLKLNWSLQGECSKNACSPDADCHQVSGGYFCQCKPGYWGDGYIAGTGCHLEGFASPVVCNGTSTTSGCVSKSGADRVIKLALITAGIFHCLALYLEQS